MTTGMAVTVTVAPVWRAGYTRRMGPADIASATASAPSLHRATPQEAAACYEILRSYAEGVDRTLGVVSWTHARGGPGACVTLRLGGSMWCEWMAC